MHAETAARGAAEGQADGRDEQAAEGESEGGVLPEESGAIGGEGLAGHSGYSVPWAMVTRSCPAASLNVSMLK